MNWRTSSTLLALLLGLHCPAGSQMLRPEIDPSGVPFSYPAAPTDAIGVRDAAGNTEITPEGYFYT
ncbi:MAG: hypothetical protein NTY38_17105, partial [Acidobacteria bacterium]|nr:hypothetical protein [Acidobacteriota bacterium]